jgi:hypothetical protein
MTPLRQRMIEDMQLRNLSAGTQRAYLHFDDIRGQGRGHSDRTHVRDTMIALLTQPYHGRQGFWTGDANSPR